MACCDEVLASGRSWGVGEYSRLQMDLLLEGNKEVLELDMTLGREH
jgi:hypothetical protein